MRLFLAAHRPGFVAVGVIEPGFLHHCAAVFQNGDLAARLVFNGGLDEAHRVHVLDLTPRPKMAEILGGLVFLVLAGPADRDIHIGAQVAVLHIAVAGAQIAQDLAQLGHIGRRLFRAPDVGTADDFHQGNAGAVEIDEGHGRVHVVNGFARVLFQVDALDPHQTRHACAHVDQHFALAHDGVVKLADLIALGQIGIKVVLAVKGRHQVDLRLQTQAGPHRLFHAEFIDDRQHAWHRRVNEGHVGIGFRPEGS